MFEDMSNCLSPVFSEKKKKSRGEKRTLKGEINIKTITFQVIDKMLCVRSGLNCVRFIGVLNIPCGMVGRASSHTFESWKALIVTEEGVRHNELFLVTRW